MNLNEAVGDEDTTEDEETFIRKYVTNYKIRTPFNLIHICLKSIIQNNFKTKFLNHYYFEKQFNINKLDPYAFSVTGNTNHQLLEPFRKINFGELRTLKLNFEKLYQISCYCIYNIACANCDFGKTKKKCLCRERKYYNYMFTSHRTDHGSEKDPLVMTVYTRLYDPASGFMRKSQIKVRKTPKRKHSTSFN